MHGYRPGALDRLGFGAATRRKLAPGLIDVCLNAYGWSGPWATRRGFDSLVQMNTGIADTGMRRSRSEKPVPLPVQALDHAIGCLMAAAAVRGVSRRLQQRRGTEARLSLARTAKLLVDHQGGYAEAPFAEESEADLCPTVEATPSPEERDESNPGYRHGEEPRESGHRIRFAQGWVDLAELGYVRFVRVGAARNA
jgi:crotonobetainyl-CoA:carnitine CoA-transferase CaiB-like acyl-CoA transferase